MHRAAYLAGLCALAATMAACGSDDDGGRRQPTATATASAVPSATATAVPTATATAEPTAIATATATAIPTATATLPPSATPTATATTGPEEAAYPAQECASRKQAAAGAACGAQLEAWAAWNTAGDAAARDAALAAADAALDAAWTAAEQAAAAAGVDCASAGLPAATAAAQIGDAAGGIAAGVNGGLDLGNAAQAACGAARLAAAGERCAALFGAESRHLRNLAGDPQAEILAAERAAAADAFDAAWAAGGSCPSDATAEEVAAAVDAAVATLVRDTIVAPGVSAEAYTTISPTGSTDYEGETLTPVCMNGSPYHFFVRRGTVNKVVMYYQGGGACWEGLTCSVATCDTNVNPDGGDNPNNVSTGFADRANPDNPFRDWHTVFVSYCSCDIHYGDAAQDYPVGESTLHVEHRGYHNARVAEKWAREHFVNPEAVFVTGSSAGAYGAWFHAVPLQRAWPASDFFVLADAGNGVITQGFLDGPFANWNFEANLPDDIPGVRESIDDGSGIPGYTEAVATYFPQTLWAHYTTAFDGGSGGQTGFYNIMLNDNDPIAGLSWWNASCAFTDVMRAQAEATAAAVPDNYRYYIGTGSRHTMWGNNKVYTDTTGGVPLVVDWIDAMLASTAASPAPGWDSVSCTDCGLLLAGDPRPSPLTPPFAAVGDDVVITCP